MASCCVLISLGSRLNKTHKRFAKDRSTAAVAKALKGLAASSGCSTKRGAATVEDYVFTVLTHFTFARKGTQAPAPGPRVGLAERYRGSVAASPRGPA